MSFFFFLFKTNEELQITLDRYRAVEDKSKEAHRKADEEREAMRKDLDSVRMELKKIK